MSGRGCGFWCSGCGLEREVEVVDEEVKMFLIVWSVCGT